MGLYNLKNIEVQEIFPGFRGKMIHSKSMTHAYWEIDEGCDLPEHSHVHEQVVNILEGKLQLIIDGESVILEPGQVYVIPSNAIHSGKALTQVKVLDVFQPVREDYIAIQ